MGRKKTTGRSDVIDDPAPPPRLALSILEFCDAHGISEGFYYKLKKERKGPREMRLGTRTLITLESAAIWRAEREAASAAEAKAKAKQSPRIEGSSAHRPEVKAPRSARTASSERAARPGA
jgi:hypothetical protein